MYILKNAFISIVRNKGRNILVGIIILVIACCSAITLAINNTAKDLINSYENSYNKELSITFDRKNMVRDVDFSSKDSLEKTKKKFEDVDSYTLEDIEVFAKNSHIDSYYYTYNISLNGKTIDKAESSDSDKKGDNNRKGPMEDKISSLDFAFTGYSSISSSDDFISGKYQISEIVEDAWDIASSGNYIFINKELADYNDLSLNDKVKFEDEDDNVYEFKIIGIFNDNDSESMDMFSNSANTIITNSKALINITSKNSSIKANINPTFIIDSYDNADKIEDYFHDKGLDDSYSVTTNEDVITSGVSSISNVKSFSVTFLIITLVIGGIVLFVINLINIRERKYEIGVLRTIGMSKLKLSMQFVSEVLMVACVALLLGALCGALMSKSVGNYLLSSEIESSSNAMNEVNANFGSDMGPKGNDDGFNKSLGKPVISAYDSIDAVVSIPVIFELFAVGIVLVFISCLSGMISIQRFSPLTILKERS